MKTNSGIFIISVLLSIGLSIADSNADPVTYKFEGKIIAVDKSLVSYFHKYQTITGTYTFESTTPATPTGNPNIVSYPALLDANISAELDPNTSVVRYSAVMNTVPSSEGISCCEQINVGNDVIGAYGAYIGDMYSVQIPLLGPSVKGIAPDFIILDLGDPTGSALTSLDLPTDIQLSSFNSSFQLTFTEVVDLLNYVQHNVDGYLTSLQRVQ